jgi:large subunit ribosomal protein L18
MRRLSRRRRTEDPMAKHVTAREKRRSRIRRKVSGTAARPRLTVYKSLKHMYAQLVDDTSGKTLVSVATTSKNLKGEVKDDDKTAAAKKVGAALAKAAKEKGIEAVVFDRNGFDYHGRIQAVAAAAREAGLKF